MVDNNDIKILFNHSLKDLINDLLNDKTSELVSVFFENLNEKKFLSKYIEFNKLQAEIIAKTILNEKISPYKAFRLKELKKELEVENEKEFNFADFNEFKITVFKNNFIPVDNNISCYDFISLYKIAKKQENKTKTLKR